MSFIIDNQTIEFKDYKSLQRFHPIISYLEEVINICDEWFDKSRDSFKFRTSGSTGSPKLISHNRDAIITSINITKGYFKLEKADKAALCLPPQSVAGKMMILRSLFLDLDLELVELSTCPNLSLDKYDFLPLAVLQFSNLLENNFSFSKCRSILLGGAPISQKLLSDVDFSKLKLYHGYGMTETLTHIAMKEMNSPSDYKKPFMALSDVKFDVTEQNQLIIHAAHLRHAIITNDIVTLNDSQSFNYLGRLDNIINSGGIKIIPEIFETNLKSYIKEEAIITSIPDAKLGQKPVLIIESIPHQQLLNQLNNRTLWQNFKVFPKTIFFVQNFILSPTGKVDRKKTFEIAKKGKSYKL